MFQCGGKGVVRLSSCLSRVLLGLLLLLGLVPAGAEETLIIGVFPRYGLRGTIEHFTPLAGYLAMQLRRPVEVRSAPSFALFEEALERGDYDIVHFNQYHYVRSHKYLGYEVIAMNEEGGRASVAGALIVRRDSGIETVAQLKGRHIVFGGGPRAMQSYVVATWLLRREGLQDGDYVQEFAGSPANAILTAYYGKSDAAGAGDVNLNKDVIRKRIETAELKILAQGPRLAHLPWAVSAALPVSLRRQIQSLLTTMHTTETGRQVLTAAELTALRPAQDRDYDPHRHIIRQVLGESY